MTEINITPEKAVEDFLDDRRSEVSKSSLRNYRYTLRRFVQFCYDNEIEYVNDLTGYDLKRFKVSRRKDEIKTITLRNNLSVLRVFLRWCEQAQLVEPDFHMLVQLPTLSNDEMVSKDKLTLDEVEDILDYFYTYEYAQRRHVIFQLIWHTCIRIGTVVAIDLDDYLPTQQQIIIRHRPDTGTPLKNGMNAQKRINLNDAMGEVLDDYIEVPRHDVIEESGRKPLFTTRNQRVSHTTIRKNMYGITRPCKVHGECPHDRVIEECEAAVRKKAASKCPSSMSPHPLRRSAITYHLNREWPEEKLSERANVTVDVLEEHYDTRSEGERAKTRKQYLDNL